MHKIDKQTGANDTGLSQPFDLSASQGEFRERRSERRVSTSLRARLRFLSPFSPNVLEVQILDVSKNGLGLQVPCRIAIETVVQVVCGRSLILGEVRYCLPLGDGTHHAGILIQERISA